jgi:hypothetical protein
MVQTWFNPGLLCESQGDREKAVGHLAQAYFILDQLGTVTEAW